MSKRKQYNPGQCQTNENEFKEPSVEEYQAAS